MTVIQFYPPPPDPLGGVKSQIFKCRNNSLSCQYFLLKFRMQTDVQWNISNGILVRRPGPGPLGELSGWGRCQNSFFHKIVVLHIKLKGMMHAKQHGSKHFASKPILPRLWEMESKGQNLTFSEHGHIAYQIKGNGKCSNMQAHILSLRIPSTTGVGSKFKTFFLKEVMLHMKQIGVEHREPCKHIFCPYTHPRPLGWVRKVKPFFLSENSHVVYQIKGNET